MSAPRSAGGGTAPSAYRSMKADGSDALHTSAPRPLLLSTAEGYEFWAPTYDGDPNPLLALEERTLEALLPDLTGKDTLDVACGTGRWLERFLTFGAASAVGLDLSTGMLAVAKTKPGLLHRLVRADCRALPFRSGIVDVAICSFALSYLPDVEEFGRELARVTRPGADCYITDLHPSAVVRGWRTGFRYAGGPVEIDGFHHSLEELSAAFAPHGLALAQVLEPHVGEPEKLIFARAGKDMFFESAASVKAILICRFIRLGDNLQAR